MPCASRIAAISLLRAKRTHIEVFAAYDGGMRPAAKNTVCRNLSVVCCLYRYLCEEGYIDCNPGEHVRRPKLYGHSDGTYLTREQARLFLAEARGMGARTDALCSLLLLTGARVGEALGLDVEDCHLNDGRPWVRFARSMSMPLSEHQRSHRDTMLRYPALVPGVRPARKPAIMSLTVSICAPSPCRSRACRTGL